MVLTQTALVFCNHLHDETQLAGAALGVSMINCVCLPVALGMGTACDTLFSQSYGRNDKLSIGLYAQKATIIFLLVST